MASLSAAAVAALFALPAAAQTTTPAPSTPAPAASAPSKSTAPAKAPKKMSMSKSHAMHGTHAMRTASRSKAAYTGDAEVDRLNAMSLDMAQKGQSASGPLMGASGSSAGGASAPAMPAKKATP
jgi:hypothetical protein